MNVLKHHGIKGQRWGVRRYQNPDGTLTIEGKKRLLDREGVKYAYKTEKDVQKVVNTFSKEDRDKFGFDSKDELYSTKEQAEATVKRFVSRNNKEITAFLDIYWEETGNFGVAVGTDKNYRGKGHQKKLIKRAKKWIDNNIDKIDAKYLDWLARPDNTASIKVAEGAGFKRDYKYNDGHEDSWNLYRYDLDKVRKKKNNRRN